MGEGGIYGCGCKEVYRFPHTTYPTSLVAVLFAAASLHSVHKKKKFFVLVPVLFVIKFYV